MQATKETVQKRPHTALWVILCVVLLCAAGAALYFCRWAEKPLTLAEGYVAAEGLTADITDGEGAVLSQPVRGTKVTYVVEDEDKDHPGLVRLVLGEDSFGYLSREQLVTDPKDVVATKTIYVRTAVNLLDEAGAVPGRLVQKGEALTVTGWQDMDASGAVGRWQVEGGYIRAEYVTMDEPSAKAQYDQEVYQLHAERGDSWGGGDAAGLDYFPREKASFEGHPMPGEVKALYLNNESIAQAAEYVEVADSCGINAFVVDIMDGGAIAYPSEVMKQYSPSAYKSAYNTLEVYQTGIKTLKDAGYYVIGRITAFNDPHLAEDHPECVIADQAGEPLQIGGMYWPSVYSRFVWQYKVELGLEAARLMGFDEIQFDYMRFPDGTWAFEEGTIDYRNENGESKAQAVQRFLMYACDRLHDAGVYVSADVFGGVRRGLRHRLRPVLACHQQCGGRHQRHALSGSLRGLRGLATVGAPLRDHVCLRPEGCPATAGDGVSGCGTHVGAGLQRHPGALQHLRPGGGRGPDQGSAGHRQHRWVSHMERSLSAGEILGVGSGI